jgi:hypothetical protein
MNNITLRLACQRPGISPATARSGEAEDGDASKNGGERD